MSFAATQAARAGDGPPNGPSGAVYVMNPCLLMKNILVAMLMVSGFRNIKNGPGILARTEQEVQGIILRTTKGTTSTIKLGVHLPDVSGVQQCNLDVLS